MDRTLWIVTVSALVAIAYVVGIVHASPRLHGIDCITGPGELSELWAQQEDHFPIAGCASIERTHRYAH